MKDREYVTVFGYKVVLVIAKDVNQSIPSLIPGGKLIDVKDIIFDIKQQKDIEGVTFLGGEPFEQAEAL